MKCTQMEFENKKLEIKELIKGKTEITRTTKFKKQSGIYLLYVDDFSDDKIIPIYIGETTDLQKRYQQHLSEICALNRFTSDYYQYALSKNFYNGKFKAIKIFKYMVDHECELSQIKMVILKKMEPIEEDLLKVELEWINKTESPFFGFNQINTLNQLNRLRFSKDNDHRSESQFFCEVIKNDCYNIKRLWDYGYTEFNFLQAFPSVRDLKYWQLSYQLELDQVFDLVSELYKDKEPDDYKRSRQYFLDIEQTKKMKKELEESKQSKRKINKLENKLKILRNDWTELDRSLRMNRNMSLYPQREYTIYPLKYLYDLKIHPPIEEISYKDSCYINIAVSNNGRGHQIPNILMIHTFGFEDSEPFSGQFFISNPATTFLEKRDSLYVEKDLGTITLHKMQFQPIGMIDGYQHDEAISILSEYKTGMNDLLFWQVDKVELQVALDYLEAHTNEKTKFLVETSESLNCLERCIPQKLINHHIVEIMLDPKNKYKT